jgi:homoserine kinase type II
MELSNSEKQSIRDRWSCLGEMTLEPIIGGSNTSYFVYTPTARFVLKIYAPQTQTAQIEYEHALLAFLQQANLSFAIPNPIPTSSGETFIHIETQQRSLRVALLPRLAGQTAHRRNLQQVHSIGCALAQLHSVLAQFDPTGQLARLPY